MNRSHALDALRGYAIMTMVLAAMEAFSVLPPWMYHCQVPPPDHVFTPSIYGITWVDLIFPFFLFSMGAAIPLSVNRQLDKAAAQGEPRRRTMLRLAWKSVLRWAKLSFFAIYCIHMYPFMMGYPAEPLRYIMPMMAFALMFILFMRNPFHLPRRWDRVVNGAAYAVAIVWLLVQPYAGGKPFSLGDADVIMLILAQVAVSGTLLYLLTIDAWQWRAAVLPVVAAITMSAHTDGSWQQWLLSSSTLSWLWDWHYQEYLIVLLLGTFAGDMTRHALAESQGWQPSRRMGRGEAALSLLLIVGNVVGLYNRWLVTNLLFTIVGSALLLLLLRRATGMRLFWRRLAEIGVYLLLLGLALEAYEGGIRKDDVTLSYLFVTSALATLALLFFTIVSDCWRVRWLSWPLEMTGRSPMVAYVAGSMVVVPAVTLAGLWPLCEAMAATPWLGFLRGVLLTALTMAVAIVCSVRHWYWKT